MFPDWISAELQGAVREKVARFEPALAQMLIDEWAGAINAGKIKKSPLGYLRELAASSAYFFRLYKKHPQITWQLKLN